MFLLQKQPLGFLKITESLNKILEKCPGRSQSVAKLQAFSLQLYQKCAILLLSFRNFVYFLRAPFNDCFSYQYNLS